MGGLYGGTRYKTKWMQEVAEGHRWYWSKMNVGSCWGAPGRKLRYWSKMNRSCGELRGKYRYWNPMNAGSLGSLMRGTGGMLGTETRWAQEVVGRRAKLRHWNQFEMRAKLLRDERGSLETKCMNAGNCWEAQRGEESRYWNQMNATKWGTEVWRVEIEKKRAEWEGGGKPNTPI